MSEAKVPVSMKALTQRINRALAKDYQKLIKARSAGEKSNLGEWYILNTYTNTVMAFNCDIEELGKETGALKPYEILSDDLASELPSSEDKEKKRILTMIEKLIKQKEKHKAEIERLKKIFTDRGEAIPEFLEKL